MGFSIFPKDTLICGLKELGINPSKSKFQLVDDLNHKLLTANIKKGPNTMEEPTHNKLLKTLIFLSGIKLKFCTNKVIPKQPLAKNLVHVRIVFSVSLNY